MTNPLAEAEAAPELTFQGRIIIEWPNTQPGHDSIPTWRVSIYDAETGDGIYTASRLRIDAEYNGWITAELTQLLGGDGQPARQGVPDPQTGKVPPLVLAIGDDGKPKEGTFRYLVSEMRVREVWKKPEACACGSTHPEGYECSHTAALPPGTECAP